MSNDKSIDVFGVGNALVDILALVEDDFLITQSLDKGGMQLVDADRQSALLAPLDASKLQLQAGGSAANTMVAIAQSGGTGVYAGKVADDEHGAFYRKGLVDAGLEFDVPPAATSAGPSGTSVILTTPDAERTMCTNLGVSTMLSPEDINLEQLAKSKYCYVEGYLWDPETPRAACVKTMEAARKNNVKVSFTFSDPFLVGRYGDDFRTVVKDHCDVVFCNAEEARMFFDNPSLEECGKKLQSQVELAFITDGKDGCLVVTPEGISHSEGFSVNAIDTVGAGDAFAGGVLYGLTNGLTPQQSARWGNYLASRVVEIHGARLKESLKSEMAKVIAEA